MMKMIFMIFIIVIAVACNENNFAAFYQAKNDFETSYSAKNIFNHFPEKIDQSSIISGSFEPSDSSNCYGIMMLTLKQNKETIEKIKQGSYTASGYYYKFPFTIMNLDFLTDSSFFYKSQTDFLEKTTSDKFFPIIDFSKNDFLLGEIPDSTYLKDEKKFVPVSKYSIPKDLMIFTIESKSGDFWKGGCNCYRVKELGKWKNGYSRGYAISEANSYVTYWLIAW